MSYTTPKKRELTQEMGVIYMALDAVTKFMAKWLDDNLRTLSPDYWDRYVVSSLYESQQKTVRDNGAKSLYDLDQPTILSVFLQNKPVLLREFKVDPQLFGYAHSIKDIRNKYFHKNAKPLSERRFHHDLETIALFLDGLGATPEIINGIRNEFDSVVGPVFKDGDKPSKSMKPLRMKLENGHDNPDSNVNKESGVTANVPTMAFSQHSYKESKFRTSQDVQDLFESVKNSLTVDFSEYKFGDCALYKSGDVLPVGVVLDKDWDWAIVLQIREENKLSIAKEISRFNRVDFAPVLIGNYIVWKHCVQKFHTKPVLIFNKSVFLPNWYIDALLTVKGVAYQPDRLGVRNNLKAADTARRAYLGTYAPRSFAEMVSLADYVFAAKPRVLDMIGSEIAILDVGSGSGAAAMGLIWSLKKRRIASIKKISICAVDGNESGLRLFMELLPRCQKAWTGVSIELKTVCASTVEAIANACDRQQFDFAVSSKFLQELSSVEECAKIVGSVRNALHAGGTVFWVSNPGIGDAADVFMNRSNGEGNEMLSLQSVEIHVNGIPNSNGSVKETVSCLVEHIQGCHIDELVKGSGVLSC